MLLGFDVSTYQGEVDFLKAKNAGINYSIIRAGYPSKFFKYFNKDAQFDRNSVESPKFLNTTAYHLFRPQWDGAWQADKFCELLAGKNFFKRVAVDVELNEMFYSKTAFQNQLKKFLDRMAVNGYPDVIIYTRGSFWDANVGNPSWAKNYDLWVARYEVSQPWYGDNDPYRPDPWYTWKLWQFSADGNGLGWKYGVESASIDLNYFNGSLEDFLVYIGETPPPPVQEDDIMHYKIITAKLNIRELPDKNSSDKGDLFLGNVVGVFQASADTLGNVWARLGLNQWACIQEGNFIYMELTTAPINKINL